MVSGRGKERGRGKGATDAPSKCLFIVFDGLGDRPIRQLGWKTPLEAARTPNMDWMARNGTVGLLEPYKWLCLGSVPGHLSLFGYNPEEHHLERGAAAALGLGLDLAKDEIAFRGNFATVEGGKVVDRRAGRFPTRKDCRDAERLVEELNTISVRGARVSFHYDWRMHYRFVMIVKGKGLSPKVSDTDPHHTGMPLAESRPLENSAGARKLARIVNEVSGKAMEVLGGSRIARSRTPVPNAILLRSPGRPGRIEGFEERYGLRAGAVAAGLPYRGVARWLGMDVSVPETATAEQDTDIAAKIDTAMGMLDSHDFVFVHFKATDSRGEDGDWKRKKEFVERADREFGRLVKEIRAGNLLVSITSDHSTPCMLRSHSADPMPFLLSGPGLRRSGARSFGETEAMKGLQIPVMEYMKLVLNAMGRLEKVDTFGMPWRKQVMR